jgi:hypothetical protein
MNEGLSADFAPNQVVVLGASTKPGALDGTATLVALNSSQRYIFWHADSQPELLYILDCSLLLRQKTPQLCVVSNTSDHQWVESMGGEGWRSRRVGRIKKWERL